MARQYLAFGSLVKNIIDRLPGIFNSYLPRSALIKNKTPGLVAERLADTEVQLERQTVNNYYLIIA